MLDIPVTRTLGVNPVSAWVESNLDALVKLYLPRIQEIEIRSKSTDSEYTCKLTFLYDIIEEIWLFPDAKYNDDKIRDFAYADGITVSSIKPYKVFNGEKVEVRIDFYADKIDFDKKINKAPKKTYKYSWEMGEGGIAPVKKYYTTSFPMYFSEFLEIEVDERENYDLEDIEDWKSKYNLKNDDLVLWVTPKPYIAARYQMPSEDWDMAEQIYNDNPNDYGVEEVEENGVIIEESDDGDDGYLMIVNKNKGGEMGEGGALDNNPIINWVINNKDEIKKIYSKYEIIDIIPTKDSYPDEDVYASNIYIFFGRKKFPKFDKLRIEDETLEQLLFENKINKIRITEPKIDTFPNVARYYTHRFSVEMNIKDAIPETAPKKTYKYSWEMKKGGMTKRRYNSGYTMLNKKSENTFIIKDKLGKEVLRTKNLNKASDYRVSNKDLSVFVIDENGNERKLYNAGGEMRRRFNDGGGVPYKNLSLEKPQVIMDSEQKTQNIAEIEIIKTKKINVPALNNSGQIRSSDDSAKLFRAIWDTDQLNVAEHFNVILLNRSNKPTGFYQHSKGGIDGTIADVEMICALAVKSLAKGVIVAHNHPSGNLQPSPADLQISKQLKDALALFKINLLDSMILIPDSFQYYSLLDEGRL